MPDRDDGFSIADVSTVLLDDAKVRKLARRCPDDGELSARIVVYMATLLASWREGRRLTASESESWIEPTEERLADLREVALFDAQNRVINRAWERYFRPAWERREQARSAGRKGASRRWGGDSDPIATPSDPIADDYQPHGDRMPDRPTVSPTDKPSVSPSDLAPTVGPKKNGSIDREERIRQLREKAADPSVSEAIREISAQEADRLEAGYVN